MSEQFSGFCGLLVGDLDHNQLSSQTHGKNGVCLLTVSSILVHLVWPVPVLSSQSHLGCIPSDLVNCTLEGLPRLREAHLALGPLPKQPSQRLLLASREISILVSCAVDNSHPFR